ncbi:MAG: tRNA (adenosine(37)-N6)-threonylcarbamoyltransferase complex ATPase subunit type 1 TsaE [Alphaproteobacteria bacterium]|jgi:tRNA threonylcarbamoyladenosine biosynthesis protein TsaE|nr:tRNA (adenosine(37)-N6)-threonylcarbamoyltransferase complex ATPase subunit type 1 TsaE [Alphaproteobacteria bacterium]
MQSFDLATENDTARLGARLAALARPGDILALHGALGAGKTSLARAFIRAFVANPSEEVPSPTFTLVQVYEGGRCPLWHLDLYRLERPEDALELGLEEGFQEAVCLIEWPERLGALLPERSLHLTLGFGPSDETRTLTLDGWQDRPLS